MALKRSLEIEILPFLRLLAVDVSGFWANRLGNVGVESNCPAAKKRNKQLEVF
jgi:hypothetical protein